MTARETTLGALTAADLGKRVVALGESGTLERVSHMEGDTKVSFYGQPHGVRGLPDTPVTVYDECVPARSGDGPCHMTLPHPPHRWDREDRTHLRWECPGVQHDKEEA